MTNQSMRIISLEASNIKRLKAIEIRPDPKAGLVQITGKNGQGKTATLDAIAWALGGASLHQSRPIRDGEQAARIKLDMGDVIVTRKFRLFKPKGDAPERVTTSITVENAEGAVYRSPQALLESLMSSLSFDPLKFVKQDSKAQADDLAKLAGIDLEASRTEFKAAYDERRDVNRDAKQARTAADMITVPENTPDESVSTSALAGELSDIQRRNQDRRHRREELERVKNAADRARERAANFAAEAVRLREQAESADIHAAEQSKLAESEDARAAELGDIGVDEDTAEILAKIDGAEEVNGNVANAKRKASLENAAKTHEAESAKLTANMEGITAGVAKALAKADLPVKGLGISDDIVTLDGLPLDQASDAKQLEVSCALAMANDSKLKVLRVRDGSLLDSESLAVLERMAETRGFQIWLERVDESGKVGFVIENGEVASRPETGEDPGLFDGEGA